MLDISSLLPPGLVLLLVCAAPFAEPLEQSRCQRRKWPELQEIGRNRLCRFVSSVTALLPFLSRHAICSGSQGSRPQPVVGPRSRAPRAHASMCAAVALRALDSSYH